MRRLSALLPRSGAYSAEQVLLNKQQIWCGGVIVSDVVEKTSTRRRSRIPCVVMEKNYDASTWKRRHRRRKKWRKL